MTPDQLAVAVVTTLAAKGAEAAFAAGKNAIAGLLRGRLRRRGRDVEVLRAAIERPDDPGSRAALVEVLVRAMADDPELAARLRAAVALDGAVVNQFSGTSAKVVQARDIHGDLSL
jgi:hypothetical protein